MAIEIISGGSLSGSIDDGGQVTLTFPAGVLENDYVLVMATTNVRTSTSVTCNTSGYTELLNYNVDGSIRNAVWYKKMGATPDSQVQVTGDGTWGDSITVIAYILRGCNTTTFIDAALEQTYQNETTNPNPSAAPVTSITTITDGAWVIAFAGGKGYDVSVTAPSGYSNLLSYGFTGGHANDTCISAVTKEITTAGAEAPGTFTNWSSMRWRAVVLAIRPARPTAPSWYNTNWRFRTKITVEYTEVDADVVNFPVYVNLANLPAGFHAKCNQTDARDIRVTRGDGTTECAREIVYYDASTDTGELHFKADVLYTTEDRDFYIYYGNPSASDYAVTDTYGRNAVWSGYTAVFHLGTDPSSALVDSTGNGYNGTSYGSMDSSDVEIGKVGKALRFNGSSQYISYSTSAKVCNETQFTVQAWSKPDTLSGTYEVATWSENYSGGYPPYGILGSMSDYSGNNRVTACHLLDPSWNRIRYRNDNDSSLNDNDWHKWDLVFGTTSKQADVYVDGSLYGSASNASWSPSTWAVDGIFIGAYKNVDFTYMYWPGLIDEIRVIKDDKSATWISTEYNNQSSPNTFYTVGAEERQFKSVNGKLLTALSKMNGISFVNIGKILGK